MKKLLVILSLFIFSLPSFGDTNKNDSYETFLQNRLDVFLYYEINDAFYRRHGYKIAEGQNTTTEPARVEITSHDRATESDYSNFYNKYKDYFSGAKSPDGDFINAQRRLFEKDISAEFIPEKKITTYYTYIAVNATNKQKINEVDKVWLAKKGKVKPKPYSFETELNKYKVLTEKDIRFVIDNFKERFIYNELYYSNDEGKVRKADKNTYFSEKLDNYFKKMFSKCNGNYELFREYAKDIDEKFKNFYPQNLYYENPQSARAIPYFINNPYQGTIDFDTDIDIILSAFEGVVDTCQFFVSSIDNNKIHHTWLGFGNKVTRVGKTEVTRLKNGLIIAIGDKYVIRDDQGKVIKIGEDIVKTNENNVIMQVGDKKFFRNSDGSVYYIGNPEYTTNERGEIATINGEPVTRKYGYVTSVGKESARF